MCILYYITWSIFQVHELLVLLVFVLINFGVKKQVPQVSFKIVVRDLISFHTFGYDMILFIYDLILFNSNFKIQNLLVMLVDALTNFSVKNQVPQFFFKFAAGDLVLVSYGLSYC